MMMEGKERAYHDMCQGVRGNLLRNWLSSSFTWSLKIKLRVSSLLSKCFYSPLHLADPYLNS